MFSEDSENEYSKRHHRSPKRHRHVHSSKQSTIGFLSQVTVNLPRKAPFKTFAVSKTMTFGELFHLIFQNGTRGENYVMKSKLGIDGVEYGKSLIMSEILSGERADIWIEKEDTFKKAEDFFY